MFVELVCALNLIVCAIHLWIKCTHRRISRRTDMPLKLGNLNTAGLVRGVKSPKAGYLSVITGPMFCSKSTTLIHCMTEYADVFPSKRVLLINNSIDTRDTRNVISSHSSTYRGISNKITTISSTELSTVKVNEYDIIGVDEAQFFEDLVSAVTRWVNNGKYVYCAGLDSDAKMEKFGHISELLHLSDSFVKLNSTCARCLDSHEVSLAPFTGKFTPAGNQVDVGNADKYFAACRFHMSV